MIQAIIEYLCGKPEAVEDYPFGPDAQVFKVQRKMFALVYSKDGKQCINLKCEPQLAIQLRDVFVGVLPGWHMNKMHWNTVWLDGSVPQSQVERMIDHSYALVVKSLGKPARLGLEARHGKPMLYGLDE